MRPLIAPGEYDIYVDDTLAGFLWAGPRLAWFLGPPWDSGRPDTFRLSRTGRTSGQAAWKARVRASGLSFARGNLGEPGGDVPAGLRPSGVAFELPILDTNPDDGQGYLQIDPGVIGVWRGGSPRLASTPDHGFGYVATDGPQRFVEAFVPLDGAQAATEVTLKVLVRSHHALDAQRAFRSRTQAAELDFDASQSVSVRDYRLAGAFWRAFG